MAAKIKKLPQNVAKLIGKQLSLRRLKYNRKMQKKLYRSVLNKKLCGVCGGIAEYFDLDPVLIRILWVCVSLFSAGFPGLLVYIIFAIFVPSQPQQINQPQQPQQPEQPQQ